MNLGAARVALRDRTLLDVFDLALRFVGAHLGAYARVSAAVSLPAFVVSWAASSRIAPWAGWMVTIALAALAQAPFVALASRLVFEERVPLARVLRTALASLPRLVALRTLHLLGLVIGLFFFVLPAVWIGALFAFSAEIVVLEGSGVGDALGRMQRLGTGWFGDVFTAMLLSALLYAAAVLLGDVAGRMLLEGLLLVRVSPEDAGPEGPLGLLGLWLALPVLTTARFFVYLNLRTRREGWDIQTRFAALAARDARAGGEA
jgi:hypothetical protein